LSPIPYVGLSVCLSGGVNYGKMADWIWMSFGMVSGVGRGMGVLDGWRSSKGRVNFGGVFRAFHCNHWGVTLLMVGVVSGVG